MTKLIDGNGAIWLNMLHLTGLLRKLAMTIHVAVIARNEAIQKTQNINVLQNLSFFICLKIYFNVPLAKTRPPLFRFIAPNAKSP